jgi:hypothetical protein
MAIFSVDGIETLKGKAASEADNGYIVNPFSNIEIKGYRIDEKNVAAFKFSDLAKGYNIVVGAEKVDKETGEVTHEKSSKNSGVIGVRVIEEKVDDIDYEKEYKNNYNQVYSASGAPAGMWNNYSGCVGITGSYITGYGMSSTCITGGSVYSQGLGVLVSGCVGVSVGRVNVNQLGQLSYVDRTLTADYSSSLTASASSCTASAYTSSVVGPAPAPVFDTSTTWGTKLEDKVKEVGFKRSDNITDIIVYYASRESLEEFGIDFSNTKQIFGWPSAFEDKKKYCKVPPGYKL